MSYRYARITNYYPQYLNAFYQKHPEIASLDYTSHLDLLVSDSIEIASSYSKSLRKLGVEAFDLVTNASPLVEAYKRENKLPQDATMPEVTIHQLKALKPDAIWIDDFALINPKWKSQLLAEVPSIKLIIGHICAPYNSVIESKFSLFDIMFTCIPCFEPELKKHGLKTYLLYHGFDSSILDQVVENNDAPSAGLLFTGSLYTGSGFHNSRIEYLENLIKAGLKIDLYCNLESRKKLMTKKVAHLTLKNLHRLGLKAAVSKVPVLKNYQAFAESPIQFYSPKLRAYAKPPVFGMEMFRILANSKVCFNNHGEVAQKCAGNIRLFEATGLGSCLLTDWKDNIRQLFEPDTEIVTYKSVEECVEKAKWLLNNDAERKKIAKAGQERTLRDHTIENRAAILHDIIIKNLV